MSVFLLWWFSGFLFSLIYIKWTEGDVHPNDVAGCLIVGLLGPFIGLALLVCLLLLWMEKGR